jgi:hypothetical protein
MTEGMDSPTPAVPDARLLIAPGCAHCPIVLDGLSALVKDGRIGHLEVVNIAVHPEAAQAAGTRTVPWFTIGPFTLTGAHSPSELAEWAERARDGSGLTAYFSHLLESNRLDDVIGMLKRGEGNLEELVPLLEGLDTPMAVRIGVGAVIEEFADTDELAATVDSLAALVDSEEPQVRADACHYLGLSRSPAAIPFLEACREDDDEEVREIAAESLALIPR